MEITNQSGFVYLCPDCVPVHCISCGTEIYCEDTFYIDSSAFCSSCCVLCENCGELFEQGALRSIWDSESGGNETYLCEACYNKKAKRCEGCGESFLKENPIEVKEGNLFCEACYIRSVLIQK